MPGLHELRAAIRAGAFRGSTSGLLVDHVHANLVILPKTLAPDFSRFCARNPAPCPLLEQTQPGATAPKRCGAGADLRTDAPRYRIYRHGRLDAEEGDLLSVWRDDLVSFLLGCSFNFEGALVAAGIAMRHQQQGSVVPMYVTDRECVPAGVFAGPLVVSMRPVPISRVDDVRAITAKYVMAHGAPVAIGEPGQLGIEDLGRPDYGEPVAIRDDEVPVYWACGVTPQAVALRAAPELLITHAPGHMFITDLRTELVEAPARG